MRKLALSVTATIAVAILVGCSQPAPTPTVAEVEPNATTRVYEQLRGGATQADVTIAEIESARNLLAQLKGTKTNKTVLEGIDDLASITDGVAAAIADFAEPPNADEVQANFAEKDDERLKAIQAFDTALLEIGDADAILLELRTALPDETVTELTDLESHFANARDALREGIRALGGDPDADSAPEEAAPTE